MEFDASCGACGAPVGAAQRFCGACGSSLGNAARLLDGRSPGDLQPQHLPDHVRRSGQGTEGELKFVTVLLADIVGSTALVDGLDPEETIELLNPALEAMIDAVHAYEGTVNKMQGDGIMALFGAPIAHEDHAVRACYAALAMQERIRQAHGNDLTIRVGLHSGKVIVRYLRSDLTAEYEADGPAVHLASRMESLAQPGAIYITGATYELAEGHISARSLGDISVKGVGTPVKTYHLQDRVEQRSRWAARVARGLSPFVGRSSEAEILRGALERARSGEGNLVAVVGGPGIGKSRLIRRFLESDVFANWSVFEISAFPDGMNASYQPISRMFRGWFGIGEQEARAGIAAKIRESIRAVDATLEAALPAMHALLDLPVEDPEWQQLGPPQRRQRIIDLIKQIVVRRAQVQPLLLFFEDLHWADAETLAVLDSLVEVVSQHRVLIVVTSREAPAGKWNDSPAYTHIALEPLDLLEAGNLLDLVLGRDPDLDDLKELLLKRADGTPLFIEESVASLVAGGALRGERGNHVLCRPVSELDVPKDVHALLAARIDRLSQRQKDLLQTAAVIGREVPHRLLALTSGLSTGEISSISGELQAAELLYQVGLPPEGNLLFKHALTQETAYASLLGERRRSIHVRCAQMIEELHRDRLDERVEQVAQHAMAGRAWRQAADFSRQAGMKALSRSAFKDAIKFYEQTIEAVGHLPKSPENTRLALEARMRLRDALTPTGDSARISDCLSQAQLLAEELDDAPTLAAIHIGKSIMGNFAGRLDSAVAEGRHALRHAERAGQLSLLIGASYILGQAHWFQGDYAAAANVLGADLHRFVGPLRTQKFGVGTGFVVHNSTLSVVRAARGEFAEAQSRAEEALQLAEELQRPFDIGFASHAVGFMRLQKGEVEAAVPVLSRGVEICRQNGIHLLFPWNACELGRALGLLEKREEAADLLEQGIEQSRRIGLRYIEALCRLSLGEVRLAMEKLPEAMQHGQVALETAEACQYSGVQALALRHLGLCKEAEGERRSAVELLLKARDLAARLEMAPELARCDAALARMHGKGGAGDAS